TAPARITTASRRSDMANNDPTNSNFAFGAVRHTARIDDQLSDPRGFARQAVGSISSPVQVQQESVTTGGRINQAGRGGRRRGGGGGGTLSLDKPSGPDLLGGSDEIIKASGLGGTKPRPPGMSAEEALNLGQELGDEDARHPAEHMSDADPPNPVST